MGREEIKRAVIQMLEEKLQASDIQVTDKLDELNIFGNEREALATPLSNISDSFDGKVVSPSDAGEAETVSDLVSLVVQQIQ